MKENVLKLLDFIKKSPTAFQAVETAKKILVEHEFKEILQNEKWDLEKGKGYFVTVNGSSIVAFIVPKEAPKSIMMAASHSDSPMFKLKQNFIIKNDKYTKIDTEPYGGIIYSTWLDKPLSLAGRVVVKEGNSYVSKLFDAKKPLFVIPNLPIHFNREINAGYRYNPACDLVPLCGSANTDMLGYVANSLGVEKENILSYDLFVYNFEEGKVWGVNDEYFSSPRIDNLMCMYGNLMGFLSADVQDDVLPVYYVSDNEETGSASRQGANSKFLTNILTHIASILQVDLENILPSSMVLSSDNAHAIHPNHPEMFDAINSPVMNGSVVIKHNSSQRYATDGFSSAIFEDICKNANIPVQHISNRSDIAGGSTIGNLLSTKFDVLTVDIGMAQLAMHSSYETAGVKDVDYIIEASKAFYNASLCYKNNEYSIKFKK